MKRLDYTFVLASLLTCLCMSCKTSQHQQYLDLLDTFSPEAYQQDKKFFTDVNNETLRNQQENRMNVDPECTLCHGWGRVVKNVPVETATPDKMVKCKECKQKFKQSLGHTHVPCPLCQRHSP